MKIAALLVSCWITFSSGLIPPSRSWCFSLVKAQELEACRSTTSVGTQSLNSEDSGYAATTSTTDSHHSVAMQQQQHLWFQHSITVTAPARGCHLITGEILKAAGSDLQKISIGMCNMFVQHTSASLTINENADPDVRTDMETALNRIVPAQWNRDGTFKHTMEGDDDMPGHVKSSLMGVSLNIPIQKGKLALGSWQGIYLNEHRDQGGWGGGHQRRIVITLQGKGQ
jgi:secondary thiamine-phosphate synthase enzyme